MKIVLAGFGKVGQSLLAYLVSRGHEVAVVDKSAGLFEDFPFENVRTVQGNAIDEHTLKDAGIEEAEVFFGVTGDENTNLMAGMMAKLLFKVPRIYALVFDPGKGGKFREYVDDAFCSTLLTSQQLVKFLNTQPQKEQPTHEPQVPEGIEKTPYFIIIIGGGKAGYYLAKELVELGYETVVVEKDYVRFEELRSSLDCGIIHGDGSTFACLRRAGAERASVLAAATRQDQTNLIACLMAKKYFGIPKTIARVTNPKNERIMKLLKVDFTVSSTSLLVHNIERGIPVMNMVHLMDLEEGLEMRLYRIPQNSPAVGKSIKELLLPKDCNILFLRRDKNYQIARGETIISPGDEVVALFHSDNESVLHQSLVGGK